MITSDIKKEMYVKGRSGSGLNQPQWERLFNMGGKGKSHVSEKELGARGVNKPEALASQLLLFIAKQGFDINNIEFDENGYIISVPVKASSAKSPGK